MSEPVEWQDDQNIEFVSLIAGGQGFCIEITEIREIRRWSPVTPLPFSQPDVLGVMNLRGSVIPIIDLSAKLGLGAITPTARHVIIVVVLSDRTVGLLVDAVSEILTIQGENIRSAPNTGQTNDIRSIRGLVEVGDGMSRVIDLRILFNDSCDLVA
ncbi:chemotaxis protein CheW [Aestuariivita boseongensis]|uniref:chemotaxis protein CheW n=1 Tax=Aestuariivita boseongensis TaxID=1470562 RepID=UPI0006836AFE|nr:chemotaxis protein CheW [Aestuariivita boseongensis]